MRRILASGATMLFVLTACGGCGSDHDEDGDGPNNASTGTSAGNSLPYWVHEEEVDGEWASFAGSVFIRAGGSRPGMPDDPKWTNHTTGEAGEGRAFVTTGSFFYAPVYSASWSLTVPLAPGDNEITITMSGETWSTTAFGVHAPPYVRETSPEAGDTNVPTSAVITATFSERMDYSAITPDTFILREEFTGILVGGTVSYNYYLLRATFTPTAPLSPFTSYEATIKTGVTDLMGNPLPADFRWTFSVNAAPVADDNTYTVLENGRLHVPLSGSHPDGLPIIYEIESQPANGSLSGSPPGYLYYFPDLNFTGQDSFTFTVTDGVYRSAPATITITVNPVNQPAE